MMQTRLCVLLALLSLAASGVIAKPLIYTMPAEEPSFREGQGKQIAERRCLACHSADYISTQPRALGAAFWRAEVSKMRKLYAAPISDNDAEAIVDYLARNY